MSGFVGRSALLHGRLLMAAIFTGLSACSSVTAPESELASARQRWAERGPTSYTYILARTCECLPETTGPVAITVQDGAVISRVYVRTGTPVAASHQSQFPPIEGVFDMIDEAIRRRTEQLRADYHPTLGYPLNIGINLHLLEVDGGLKVIISEFRTL